MADTALRDAQTDIEKARKKLDAAKRHYEARRTWRLRST